MCENTISGKYVGLARYEVVNMRIEIIAEPLTLTIFTMLF